MFKTRQNIYILLDLVGLSPSNVTDDADASASDDSPAIEHGKMSSLSYPNGCLLCTEYISLWKKKMMMMMMMMMLWMVTVLMFSFKCFRLLSQKLQ